ncbi:CLUMA_CG003715, isoform A [Clunio marinus]|uniref:CLUMA_CG003715, isoform A n=1 Tax=Clunio marinus TaxID=568069 RepID=A0A1J1HRG8_9DIPT|nr:CLUMA_CG003715, isoform A [Clunio marinus]
MISKQLVKITILISFIINVSCVGEPPVETIKQWNLISFDFPYEWPVHDKDLFNPEQIVVTGLEIGKNRVFLALPRLFSGVPATIASVSRDTIGDSPVLNAYPDWTHHSAGVKQYNCSDLGLISVYRLKIDSCNRLWALDAGVSRSLEDFEVTCPPKILIYDLNTDQVVRRIDFPKEVVRKESLFTNIIVDETTSLPENHCDDAVVYITDTVEPALVVYDSGRDLTWRLSHPSMYADPAFSESRIGNDRFNLSDGVVGLAFDEESRTVYFQPLATDRLFSVSTAALRAGPLPVGKELPVKLVGKKSSQGIGLGASPYGGNIFFAPLTETAIAQFNPKTNEQKVLAYDYETLQFIADFKTTKNDPSALYFVSSRFHRFFLKSINPYEINTRILRINNVVQSSPSIPFAPVLPSYQQNGLNQYSLPDIATAPAHTFAYQAAAPSLSPIYPHHQQYPTSAFSSNYVSKNGFSNYNFAQHYPTKNIYPTSPVYGPPTNTFPFVHSSTRPVYKFQEPQPYNYEQFSVIDRRNSYPFQKLNAGETLPQPNNLVNLNFGYSGNAYKYNRFARNLLQNTTSYH